jgi:hypothetical protein
MNPIIKEDPGISTGTVTQNAARSGKNHQAYIASQKALTPRPIIQKSYTGFSNNRSCLNDEVHTLEA